MLFEPLEHLAQSTEPAVEPYTMKVAMSSVEGPSIHSGVQCIRKTDSPQVRAWPLQFRRASASPATMLPSPLQTALPLPTHNLLVLQSRICTRIKDQVMWVSPTLDLHPSRNPKNMKKGLNRQCPPSYGARTLRPLPHLSLPISWALDRRLTHLHLAARRRGRVRRVSRQRLPLSNQQSKMYNGR